MYEQNQRPFNWRGFRQIADVQSTWRQTNCYLSHGFSGLVSEDFRRGDRSDRLSLGRKTMDLAAVHNNAVTR